jgi:Rap1a immunity proteins
MQNILAAAFMVCALALPATAAESSNFNLQTTRDLVALCSGEPDQSLYTETLQFCYGFMAGVAQLHRALVRTGDLKPLACPQYAVTREALAQVFLDWVHANPDAMDQPPGESLKRAAAAAWPCGG